MRRVPVWPHPKDYLGPEMPLIELLDESFRNCLYEYSGATHQQFKTSVRPVYGAAREAIPELIGSCVLLRVNGVRYGVTASHVIDHISESHLYIGGSAISRPAEIHGEIISTAAPEGNRDNDHHDFSFFQIPEESFLQLGEAECIEVADISHNRTSFDSRLYMAMGYPISKNRGRTRINPSTNSIKATSWTYIEGVKPMRELAAEIGVSGENHFFQPYGKYSMDSDGQRVSSVSPKGLSGGALIDLGNFASPDKYDPSARIVGHLAGIFIAMYPNYEAVSSVRIQPVLDAIHNRFH